jgi:hypothetical protein
MQIRKKGGMKLRKKSSPLKLLSQSLKKRARTPRWVIIFTSKLQGR